MNTLLTAEEALEVISGSYNLTDIDYCMFIRRGFNDMYLVEAAGDKYVFRIYLTGKYYVESDDAYRFELDLIQHLHKQGVPVAACIPTESGDLLGEGQTPQGVKTFALFHYADGIPLGRNSITTAQSRQMGVAMANLHLAANSLETGFERYKLDQKYLVDEPTRLITEGEKSDKPGPGIERGREVLNKLQPIQQYIDRLDSIGTDGDKFGIIHADMHFGNIHFRGNELTIFDFDHCAYGWRAYDLAVSTWLPKEQRDSMVEGYESIRPLSPEERDSLQDLCNLRNLWDIGDILATENLRS